MGKPWKWRKPTRSENRILIMAQYVQIEFYDPATGECTPVGNPVEVEPGIWTGEIDEKRLPRHSGWASFKRTADGSWIAVVRSLGRYARMHERMAEDFGLREKPNSRAFYTTLRRLIAAGFVDAAALTDDCWYVDVESLIKHWSACRKPGFWTPERKARLRAARQAVASQPLAEAREAES